MGIPGLLPLLKSVTRPTHVKEYAGHKVAVDTYSWLHRGALSCSKDLLEGKSNRRFIDYCMHRVRLLQHFGVVPVMIFDGALLPMKSDQEMKRSRSRSEHLSRAEEHERAGNISAAYECYQKALDITPEIAYMLIKVLRRENIELIVAPYEADAQMAYLAIHGYVHAVITEDSDMIAYSCPRVLYKMDKFGQGSEIQYADLQRNKDINLSNFTPNMIVEMCILGGCDYLPSLPGLGIKKAHNLMRRFRSYKKVIKSLIFSGVNIPKDYESNFERAILTFRHQRVFDPSLRQLVQLHPSEGDSHGGLHFAGPEFERAIACAIADGSLNPLTLQPFENIEMADSQIEASPAVIVPKSMPGRQVKRRNSLPIQKNKLSMYFVPVSSSAKKSFKAPRLASSQPFTDSQSSLDKLLNLPEDGNLFETPEASTSPTPSQSQDLLFSSADLEGGGHLGSSQPLSSPFKGSLSSQDHFFSQASLELCPNSAPERSLEFDNGVEVLDLEDSQKSNVFANKDCGLSPDWRVQSQGKAADKEQNQNSIYFASLVSNNLQLSDSSEDAISDPCSIDESQGICFSEETQSGSVLEGGDHLQDEELQLSGNKFLKDPSLKSFATDISHVQKYGHIGHSALTKFEVGLGTFRHSSAQGNPHSFINSAYLKRKIGRRGGSSFVRDGKTEPSLSTLDRFVFKSPSMSQQMEHDLQL